jgi:hypothetical protein
VTAARPGRWDTPLGVYEFRHIRTDRLRGYRLTELGGGQRAFVATAEKALLDLVYLQPDGDSQEYLQELRLHELDGLNLDELERQAGLSGSPKLRRAASRVRDLARAEPQEFAPR